MPLTIGNARVLAADGTLARRPASIEGETVGRIGGAAPDAGQWSAAGALLLPGIVDLHGDAFERQTMPGRAPPPAPAA